MRRRIAIVGAALTCCVAAGLVVSSCLAEDFIERVALPRAAERLGVELSWDDLGASLGSVTVRGLEVHAAGPADIRARVPRLQVRYALFPLVHGRVDVTRLDVDSLDLLIDGELVDSLSWLRSRARQASGRGRGGGGSGRFPEVRMSGGRLRCHEPSGREISVERIGAELEPDGLFRAHVGAARVALGAEGPVVAATRAAEVSGRVVEGVVVVDEAEVDSPLVTLSEDRLRALLGDDGGEAGPDREAEPTQRSPAPQVALKAMVRLSRGRIDLVRPGEQAGGQVFSLVDLEGTLFVGNEAEPPLVSVRGRTAPGDGAVRLTATVVEGSPRLHVIVDALSVAQVAASHLPRGVELDPSSALDADITVERLGDAIGYDGEVRADGLSVQGRLIAGEPLTGLRGRVVARGTLRPSSGEVVVEQGRVWINDVEVVVAGRVARHEGSLAADATAELTPIGCDALMRATPTPLRNRLAGLELTGTIGGRVHFVYDSRTIEDTILEVDLANHCEATGSEALSIERLRQPFIVRARDSEGEEYEFVTGPGSEQWAALSDVSPPMVTALLTTEDGRFFSHRGFSLAEIRRALIRDLRAGAPRFGASTMTMQLAKNLYLDRERTVARKLQEAVLTWYLESNLTKPEILELYLNIVELGPRIHGIRHAAMHYFGRTPDDLSAREAVFLAKLLPSPVRRHEATYSRGELPERWQGMIDRVLWVMRERRYLSEEELTTALAERLVFHRPGDPLPEPREVSAGRLRLGSEYDTMEEDSLVEEEPEDEDESWW